MKTTTILILNLWAFGALFFSNKTMPVQNPPTHFENSVGSGKALFEQNCAKCHGLDGTKGKFGAKNLQKSALTDGQYLRIIQKGKGIIPSWEKKLNADQIKDIISYIKTLKE
ncbi:MAG: cytochrome c [Chitinophagaceae bacterium]|nr:MAG: cytochrome c [Chitinophagaceae bacterium]